MSRPRGAATSLCPLDSGIFQPQGVVVPRYFSENNGAAWRALRALCGKLPEPMTEPVDTPSDFPLRRRAIAKFFGRRFGGGLVVGLLLGGVIAAFVVFGWLITISGLGLLLVLGSWVASPGGGMGQLPEMGIAAIGWHLLAPDDDVRLDDLHERDRRRLERELRRQRGYEPEQGVPPYELDRAIPAKREVPYWLRVSAPISGIVAGFGSVVVPLLTS